MLHNSFLLHLQRLFEKPEIAFIEINREYHPSFLNFFKNYLAVFLFLIPASFLIKHMAAFRSFKILFKKGLIEPLGLLIVFFVGLYVFSIIIEEAGRYFGGRIKNLTGVKICFFSAIPSLAMIPLTLLPYVGKLFILMSLGNWVYLMVVGSKTLLFFPGIRMTPWLVSVLFSCALLVLLVLIGLNIVKLISPF